MTARTVSRRISIALTAVFLLSGGMVPQVRSQTGSGGAAAGGDAGLWQLWTRQNASPEAYAELAEAWRGFAAGRPAGDPHVPVAHTLAAWNALKIGRVEEAKALLQPYATVETAVGTARGAREIARGWLTCLDREVLVAALDAYRIGEVRYPARLADLEHWPRLPATLRPSFQDRWGNPWVYNLERLKSMPMLHGQRYSLTSRMLGDTSALEVALALTYAQRLVLRPVQIRAVPGRQPLVALAGDDPEAAPALIQVGAVHQGVGVAYVSPSLVILHDRLHWKLFPTPKP